MHIKVITVDIEDCNLSQSGDLLERMITRTSNELKETHKIIDIQVFTSEMQTDEDYIEKGYVVIFKCEELMI